jgi:hypothetical protein
MGRRRLLTMLAIIMLAMLAVPVTATGQAATVDRIAGQDRIRTAVRIADQAYDQAGTAVLATARNYPDALSGSVLAHTLDAPLLLVEPNTVPAPVLNAMDRLGVTDVVLLGGEAAISSAAEEQLAAHLGGANRVDRISGATGYSLDRYAYQTVVDVPAKLSAGVRTLSGTRAARRTASPGPRRKTINASSTRPWPTTARRSEPTGRRCATQAVWRRVRRWDPMLCP